MTGEFFRVFFPIKTDDGVKPPFGKGQIGPSVRLFADMEAFPAKNAPVGVVKKIGVLLGRLLLEHGFQMFGLEPHLQKPGNILQGAFLVRRAMCAVHKVCGEEVSVRTSIPWDTVTRHEGTGWSWPAISTKHILQEPEGSSIPSR